MKIYESKNFPINIFAYYFALNLGFSSKNWIKNVPWQINILISDLFMGHLYLFIYFMSSLVIQEYIKINASLIPNPFVVLVIFHWIILVSYFQLKCILVT